jgi:hypothetical protein
MAGTSKNKMLSPKQIREKADILETNLFKSISRQTDPSKIRMKIDRTHFPDPVISKAFLQLTPRFNINPRDYFVLLRDLLQKEIPPGKQENFTKILAPAGETLYDDRDIIARNFEAIASDRELEIIIRGVPARNTIHGEIAKSFFNHEESPGKLLEGGVINFKEINKYPIINAGENLFFISHEIPGKPGISFDGRLIPVEEAAAFSINIGPGVKRIDDPDVTGTSKGYLLQARTTGVVILDRDADHRICSIDIKEEVDVEKLDYSTGNIGTRYTCPIRMKIGVICSGFKLRVNGKVEALIVDGGEIITNDEAVITKTLPGTAVMALKDITVDSITRSKIISEHGTITIKRELIDSKISAPRVVFEKSRGLITNNTLEGENLVLTGLYFSGENKVHFGTNLFAEKKELINSGTSLDGDRLELTNRQTVFMKKLQMELKRLAKLTLADPDLVRHVKPLILATKTMDYDVIFREMDGIQARNNTRIISSVRKLFEDLEKIPQSLKACDYRQSTLDENMNAIDRRMASMHLSVDGFLRPGATIKVYCPGLDDKKPVKPDFMIESDTSQDKFFKVKGSYSPGKGFEFVQ